ncbi:MAG TPA: hypothetical protein VM600_01470, partial [Actinomycetota bacterium]|nr:hypothetical protein [Actinomycetota bacterium]
AFTDIPPPPDVEPLPDIFYEMRKGVSVEDRLYLENPGALTAREPSSVEPPALFSADQPASYESAPFDAARAIGGVTVEAFIGTTKEAAIYRATNLATVEVVVNRVTPAGAVEIARGTRRLQFTYTAYPFLREWVFPLDEDVVFDEGDRLRVSVILKALSPPVPAGIFIYADNVGPSSVGIGARLDRIAPNSSEDCMERPECVEIGGARQRAEFWCPEASTGAPEEIRYAVEWYGPPGSSAILNCGGYVMATCTVPGEATDPWARCYAESLTWPETSGSRTECLYVTRDGARVGGRGSCRALVLVDEEP